MIYKSLLQPELYYESEVVRFIETLSEPEIESASEEQLIQLRKGIMSTDHISDLAKRLSNEAKDIIIRSGAISPRFFCYLDQEHRINFGSETKMPTHPQAVKKFLQAAKALAFSRSAQCIFFRAMQFFNDNKPVFGQTISEDSNWGILVIGSSLRGNCFIRLEQKIGEENFKVLEHKIMREGQYNYPYSRFFHIEDHEEMIEIIRQALKLTSQSIPEKECLINFATTLKALDFFGYGKANS